MRVSFSEIDKNNPLRIHVLASGSKGNAALIEDSESGRAVLVDCGVCKRDFFEGCATVSVDPQNVEGILITHDHTDHTKGLGVVTRGLAKQGLHPKIYASAAVCRKSSEIISIRQACEVDYITRGDSLSIAGMSIRVFPTSHDAAESFGFRFDGLGDAIGYMTDTGYVMDEAFDALRDCRVLALESNHDVRMLETGPYPYVLKQRVSSDIGHLSNDQASQALESLLSNKLEQVVAMHISENNNTYRLPTDAFSEILSRNSHSAETHTAYQRRITSL